MFSQMYKPKSWTPQWGHPAFPTVLSCPGVGFLPLSTALGSHWLADYHLGFFPAFLESYINRIIQLVLFFVYLLLLAMFLGVIQVVTFVSGSFIFIVEWYSTVWINHNELSIHLLRDIWVVSTFPLLWNKVSLGTFIFPCLRWGPTSNTSNMVIWLV